MYEMVYGILNTLTCVVVLKISGVVMLVAFIAYFFSKEGRDERGRGIIGTASVFSVVSLVVTLNIVGYFTNTVMSDIRIFTSAMCLVINTFFAIELIAIAVLRKLR